jgi:CBS domain-containing protein
MQVSAAMSPQATVATPDQTIREAARLMEKIDSGFLPVGEDDRLVGMITDRDIAIRAVGEGKGPDREVMTRDVKYCFEDDDLADVAKNMGDEQVRRLPVVNRDKRLVGVVSLADIAGADSSGKKTGKAIKEVTRPGGSHQT